MFFWDRMYSWAGQNVAFVYHNVRPVHLYYVLYKCYSIWDVASRSFIEIDRRFTGVYFSQMIVDQTCEKSASFYETTSSLW